MNVKKERKNAEWKKEYLEKKNVEKEGSRKERMSRKDWLINLKLINILVKEKFE